jgi:large subunit ribosomal protein L13
MLKILKGEKKMATFMPKASDITRKWYIIDAENKPLGRVAAAAATILRGKNKPTFAPHADCGDHVIIINCSKAVLTGKKLQNKVYYHHSGWIGGLKTEKYSDMMVNNPGKAMMLAVGGMLPKNTVGRKSLTRLRVYAGAEHEQTAQKPESFTL